MAKQEESGKNGMTDFEDLHRFAYVFRRGCRRRRADVASHVALKPWCQERGHDGWEDTGKLTLEPSHERQAHFEKLRLMISLY